MEETSPTEGKGHTGRRHRSTLPKPDARRRYLEMGSLVALEQIRQDARVLDVDAMAIGPFARLDAGAVASRDGKTRGAITNLFGSQAAYQAATMHMTLDAGDIAELANWPSPAAYRDAESWISAFFSGQSARGPRHEAEPSTSYASLWTLWLGAVPYGVWSERVAAPSMDEYIRRVAQLEAILAEALAHFGLSLRPDVTLVDLACGVASLVEGVWLNQCLTSAHPRDTDQPISETLVRTGRMLWRGAVMT